MNKNKPFNFLIVSQVDLKDNDWICSRYRRRYKESWLLGYKLSTGAIATTDNPTDDNYIALACCILGNMSCKKALQLMDLCPDNTIDAENTKYKRMGPIIYILNTLCGVPRKKVAEILEIDFTTVNKALRYAGLYRDGRGRRNKEE